MSKTFKKIVSLTLLTMSLGTVRAFAYSNGWSKGSNGKWTYVSNNNKYVNGKYEVDGKEYIFDNSGYMITGWYKDLNNNWYYCYPSGQVAKNTIINGYKLNENGVWVTNEQNEINYTLEELEKKKDNMNAREEVKDIYSKTLDLYKDIKSGCFLQNSMFAVNKISNEIKIDEDKSICGWAEINWANTIINSYKGDLEKIIENKKLLTQSADLSNEEKEVLELSDKLLIYICKHQDAMNILSEKLRIVSNYDISVLKDDKYIYEWNQIRQNTARDTLELYNQYNLKIVELRDVLGAKNN